MVDAGQVEIATSEGGGVGGVKTRHAELVMTGRAHARATMLAD